jgi:hypothetical protein
MDADILNVVVLPLLGGYIFYSKFHLTSFAAARAEGQRLIYSSSAIGVILLVTARLIDLFLDATQASEPLRLASHSVGHSCVVAGCWVAAIVLLTFCRPADLREVRKAKPRLAIASGFLLAGAAFVLVMLEDALTKTYLPWLAVYICALMMGLVFAAKWVIETSRLHYSIVLARLSLLWVAVWSAYTAALIYGPQLAQLWPKVTTIEYAGTALLACGIGAIAWAPFNVVLTEKWAWRRAHQGGQTSGLEHLLFEAFSRAALVQITLKDGKVYVGFLVDMPAPKARTDGNFIEFVPVKSGYRRQTTKAVVTTTNYAHVLAKMTEEAKRTENGRTALDSTLVWMTKVVPVSEVLVAGMYSEQYTNADFALAKASKKPKKRRAPSQGGGTTGQSTSALNSEAAREGASTSASISPDTAPPTEAAH